MASGSSVMGSGEQQQQRRTPRYPFTAPAAILPETGAPIGGNVKELSLYGCYLDAESTLAARSRVLVKIFMPGEYFEANASVAYANPTLGLGLVFRDVKPHFLVVLRKWLSHGDAGGLSREAIKLRWRKAGSRIPESGRANPDAGLRVRERRESQEFASLVLRIRIWLAAAAGNRRRYPSAT